MTLGGVISVKRLFGQADKGRGCRVAGQRLTQGPYATMQRERDRRRPVSVLAASRAVSHLLVETSFTPIRQRSSLRRIGV